MPVIDTTALIENRVAAIRDYHQATGIRRAELDVSGGVDSAVLLNLLVRALGADQITAVYIGIHSGEEFRQRALEVAGQAGTALIDFDATELFDGLMKRMLDGLRDAGFDDQQIQERMAQDRTVLGSIRSCLRAPIGRGFNRMTGGGVRHGTGNECEDRFLRFYQKGGDGEVDTNPIAMLSKGEVFQIGRGLGVPRSILTAVPSPDLHAIGETHNDEDELHEMTGVHWTYSQVDADSGLYTHVGSIEKLSRFVDRHPELFGADDPAWEALTRSARGLEFGQRFDDQQVVEFLRSARKLEATTRHKWNPNCPSLGVRADLLAAGLLTDELPAPTH